MDVLDLLLKADKDKFKLPEADVKIKRLSKELGEDVIFTVRALPLDKLEEIRTVNEKNDDFHAMMVVEAVKTPNLRSKELKEKFGTLTPIDTLKKILLAGEIEELYFMASKLSGYNRNTIEEVKKK